jgi:hypothetical protein
MAEEMQAPELAQIVAQLRELLAWLDANGYSHAAIDINSALEKLDPGCLTIDDLVSPN